MLSIVLLWFSRIFHLHFDSIFGVLRLSGGNFYPFLLTYALIQLLLFFIFRALLMLFLVPLS